MTGSSWESDFETDAESGRRRRLFDALAETPIPDEQILANLGLFLRRQSLTRIIFMWELYQQAVDNHGDILEFGTRWGQNIALFANFRGMLEPYNTNRKIVGFDTFTGFPESSITEEDGDEVSSGEFETRSEYAEYLRQLMDIHEAESPNTHIKKYEVVEGDVEVTLEDYLEDNPQTIVALAYFDLDLYQPTKTCLELLEDHLPKGAVIGFDELNADGWPGETLAFKEIFGVNQYEIRRSRYTSIPSYVIKT